MKPIKVNNTTQEVSIGSKAHQYWQYRGYEKYFKLLRPGLKIPKNLNYNNVNQIVKLYNLRGVTFGNWLNNEDRLNYLHAMFIAFYDMNKVLKFGYNIGINKNLTVCFGDRGIPGSLAHYNAASLVININRFERGTQEDKEIRFLTTGGIHSFAHEYGHFLDFFAGSVLEPQKAHFSCSGGHSIRRSKMGYNSPMREQFDIILDKIIFANGKLSAYYQNLLKKNLTEYWFRRTELFARAFEVYIANELNQIGIKNKFLTKPQYEQFTYISTQQLQSVLPNFRKLISLIRKKIQK